MLADIKDELVVLRIQPADPDRALAGHIQGVEELGQRRLAAAVMAQDRQKLAVAHAHRHAADGVPVRVGIGVGQAAGDDPVFIHVCQSVSSCGLCPPCSMKNGARKHLRAPQKENELLTVFFHPDCTVGSGIAPDRKGFASSVADSTAGRELHPALKTI